MAPRLWATNCDLYGSIQDRRCTKIFEFLWWFLQNRRRDKQNESIHNDLYFSKLVFISFLTCKFCSIIDLWTISFRSNHTSFRGTWCISILHSYLSCIENGVLCFTVINADKLLQKCTWSSKHTMSIINLSLKYCGICHSFGTFNVMFGIEIHASIISGRNVYPHSRLATMAKYGYGRLITPQQRKNYCSFLLSKTSIAPIVYVIPNTV